MAKLNKTPELKERYNVVLTDMETNGIIEEVSESNSPYIIYYLPHSPVVRGSSLTTKIRHVCDASATGYNHISLNDITFLAPDLTGVLMRFRR